MQAHPITGSVIIFSGATTTKAQQLAGTWGLCTVDLLLAAAGQPLQKPERNDPAPKYVGLVTPPPHCLKLVLVLVLVIFGALDQPGSLQKVQLT